MLADVIPRGNLGFDVVAKDDGHDSGSHVPVSHVNVHGHRDEIVMAMLGAGYRGRAAFREVQLRAAVNDDPETAADQLQKLAEERDSPARNRPAQNDRRTSRNRRLSY